MTTIVVVRDFDQFRFMTNDVRACSRPIATCSSNSLTCCVY